MRAWKGGSAWFDAQAGSFFRMLAVKSVSDYFFFKYIVKNKKKTITESHRQIGLLLSVNDPQAFWNQI